MCPQHRRSPLRCRSRRQPPRQPQSHPGRRPYQLLSLRYVVSEIELRDEGIRICGRSRIRTRRRIDDCRRRRFVKARLVRIQDRKIRDAASRTSREHEVRAAGEVDIAIGIDRNASANRNRGSRGEGSSTKVRRVRDTGAKLRVCIDPSHKELNRCSRSALVRQPEALAGNPPVVFVDVVVPVT